MQDDMKMAGLAAINPVLAFWTLPLVMAQGWWSMVLGLSARTDQKDRTPKGTKQLPVPVVHQDDKDRELFA
jgi:hypothetical protein